MFPLNGLKVGCSHPLFHVTARGSDENPLLNRTSGNLCYNVWAVEKGCATLRDFVENQCMCLVCLRLSCALFCWAEIVPIFRFLFCALHFIFCFALHQTIEYIVQHAHPEVVARPEVATGPEVIAGLELGRDEGRGKKCTFVL